MIYGNQRYFDLQLAKFIRDGRHDRLPAFQAEIAVHARSLHMAPTFHAFFELLDIAGWAIVDRRQGARFEARMVMPCGQSFGVSGTHQDPEQLKFKSWEK